MDKAQAIHEKLKELKDKFFLMDELGRTCSALDEDCEGLDHAHCKSGTDLPWITESGRHVLVDCPEEGYCPFLRRATVDEKER